MNDKQKQQLRDEFASAALYELFRFYKKNRGFVEANPLYDKVLTDIADWVVEQVEAADGIKCPLCFGRLRELEKVVEYHYIVNHKYKCSICGEVFHLTSPKEGNDN